MSIMAIDPANLSGWALMNTADEDYLVMQDKAAGYGLRFKHTGTVKIGGNDVDYGTYKSERKGKTKTRSAELPHWRTYHMFSWVRDMLNRYRVETLVCEQAAAFQRGKSAVEVAHKLRAAIEVAVLDATRAVELVYTTPNDLKEFALNKRSGSKEEMVAAAESMYGYPGIEDNEADALHLMAWGTQ